MQDRRRVRPGRALLPRAGLRPVEELRPRVRTRRSMPGGIDVRALRRHPRHDRGRGLRTGHALLLLRRGMRDGTVRRTRSPVRQPRRFVRRVLERRALPAVASGLRGRGVRQRLPALGPDSAGRCLRRVHQRRRFVRLRRVLVVPLLVPSSPGPGTLRLLPPVRRLRHRRRSSRVRGVHGRPGLPVQLHVLEGLHVRRGRWRLLPAPALGLRGSLPHGRLPRPDGRCPARGSSPMCWDQPVKRSTMRSAYSGESAAM